MGLHGLRLVHAGPLWRDEASAFHVATAPTLGEVVATHESFPPPFFFVVRAWVAVLGGSDPSLRLFCLLVGLGLLAVLWWTARRIGVTVPLVALSLVAVNPSFLLYGDSLRGYGLGTLAIVAAFGAFARLAARPDRRAIAAAAVTSVLSVQLLLFNAPLLLALGLAAIGVGVIRRRPRVVWAVVAVGAAVALSLLLWIEPMLATRAWSGMLKVSVGPREILGEMARTASAPVRELQWVWLLLGALALLPIPSRAGVTEPVEPERVEPERVEPERETARLFALFALPGLVLAQCAFLQVLGYMPQPWYFLAVLAVAAAALDVRLAASPAWRAVRLATAVLAVLVLALPATSLARVRMTNVDLVAARIAAEAAPGDLVVVAPWYMGVSYARYARGATPWVTLPDLADHRRHRFDLLQARMKEREPLAGVLGEVERTLRSGNRVWLAGQIEIPPPGASVPAQVMQAWSQQLRAFLRDHATQGGRVPVPWNGPVNGYEHLELLSCSTAGGQPHQPHERRALAPGPPTERSTDSDKLPRMTGPGALQRSLGLTHATAMVVGTIIGASIFVQPSEITKLMPSATGILLVWLAAGALTLCGALVCAELASAFPRTGGVYVFLKEAYSPAAGFLWGWAMFWSMHSGIIAAVAIIFARFTAHFVPLGEWGLRLTAAALILGLSTVHYFGVRHGGRVQNIFTGAKLVAIVALLVAGLFWRGATAPPTEAEPGSPWNFILALGAGLFAFGGWHMVTYTAGETKDAARTIPRALLLGTLIVTACYAGLNALYLRVLPLDAIRASSRVAADAADALLGGGGASLMAGLVMISTFGAVNGILLSGPRVYFSMAEDGLLFRWLAAAHPRFQTPHRAILLQAVWAATLALTGTYRALFTRVIYTEWIFFALLAAGLFNLRRRPDYKPVWRIWGYPLVPAAFVVASLMIVAVQIRAEPRNSAEGLGIVLLGIPFYLLWTRLRRRREEEV